MWQKTRSMSAGPGRTPRGAIAAWKAHFPEFWPTGNRFAGALAGISPGDVALPDLAIGGGAQLSTGVFVLHAGEESFMLMTPQGHMFAVHAPRRAANTGGAVHIPGPAFQAQLLAAMYTHCPAAGWPRGR